MLASRLHSYHEDLMSIQQKKEVQYQVGTGEYFRSAIQDDLSTKKTQRSGKAWNLEQSAMNGSHLCFHHGTVWLQ